MLGKSRLKYIQSFGHKKHRDLEGRFVAEGPRMAEELISSRPSEVLEVFALETWAREAAARFPWVSINTVTPEELGRISQLSTPNQVLTLMKQFPEKDPDPGPGFTLVLDTIQDPGNLGTIIRIADWFGVSGIVCSESTADRYNPKVVQATMGSIARVDISYTSLEDWLRLYPDIPSFAAVLEGTSLRKINPPSRALLLIGNEARGLSPVLLELVKEFITIDRVGAAESLNAAVATGIILSHLIK